MKKKVYISPISEIMNLRAMHAMMDEPLFNQASLPKVLAPKQRETEVF